uniref:Calponin-homology (CH) domain-containing protein n=1 Tax=Oncorhynchus tshawytscha TaxID=74940 RepID=A0A8C8FY47_ONCTS
MHTAHDGCTVIALPHKIISVVQTMFFKSERGQKQMLQTLLESVNQLLRPHGWSIDSLCWSPPPSTAIHTKNLVATLYLLVTLAMHYLSPIRLSEQMSVQVVVVKFLLGFFFGGRGGILIVYVGMTITFLLSIIFSRMMIGRFLFFPFFYCISERDAFDTLLDHTPDKLNVMKEVKYLKRFKHAFLYTLGFADGVYLVLLMGLLEDYFVPLYSFFLTPENFEQKVHNVAFAFELMQDGGLKKPKAKPDDIVNLNLKSTLRVLYNIFTKYKNSE